MKRINYTGQTLDNRYRILKLLGAGGMGAVYLGQHVVVGKKVAVKFLHSEYASKCRSNKAPLVTGSQLIWVRIGTFGQVIFGLIRAVLGVLAHFGRRCSLEIHPAWQ